MGLTRPKYSNIVDTDYKASVRVVTTTNITLSGGAPSTYDSLTFSAGDRVLVAGQSTGSQNGIYTVTTVGSGSNGTWDRSFDTNSSDRLTAGMQTVVGEGTYAGQRWILTTPDPIVLGTTSLTFVSATSNPGGLTKQVQYNAGGSLSGATNLIYDNSTGNVVATATTTSTSTTTGALVVNGGVGITGNLNASNVVASSGFTMGSQVFYAQGTNGFSVNENYDPSNNSGQTAYHFTSGATRANIAFTLARTGQFTDGFGVYGTSADNTFVTFGEQSNTSFEWRKGIGIQPLNLSGGTQLMKLSSAGNLVIPTATTSTSTTTGALVVTGGVGIGGNLNVGGNLVITNNLTVQGTTVTINSATLSIQDPIINLGTPADLTALTVATTADIGLKFHYYDTLDSAAFLGRAVDTGYLEWYAKGSDTANVFAGTSYGTIKAGAGWLTNTTPATSATTGTLRVDGGMGIAGNIWQTGQHTISNTTTSTSTVSGALIVAGGMGIQGNVWVGSANGAVGNINIGFGDSPSLVSWGAIVGLTRLSLQGDINQVGFGNITALGSRYSRGSQGAPTSVDDTDRLGALFHGGYHSALSSGAGGWINPTLIATFVEGSTATVSTAIPGKLSFFTTPINGTRTERLTISSVGNVGIGTTTTTAANLTVQGATTGTGQAADGAPIALFQDGQPRNAVSIRGGVDGNAINTSGVLNVGGGANRTYSLTTTHGVLLGSTGTGANVVVAASTASTSTLTGALVVLGGVGVVGDSYYGGNFLLGTTGLVTGFTVNGGGAFYSQGQTTYYSGTSNGLTLGSTDKASTPAGGGQGVIGIYSKDPAASQLQGTISLVTDATATNRRLAIGIIEQGTAYRNITLAESGGVVGIGTAVPSPTNASTMVPKLVAVGSSVNGAIQAIRTTTPGVGGAQLIASTTRGTDATSYTALQNGDGIGTLGFYGTDGTQFISAASVSAVVDAAVSTNNVLGRLTFGTSPGGANAILERMRIDSSGNVGIGNTAPLSNLSVTGNTYVSGNITAANVNVSGNLYVNNQIVPTLITMMTYQLAL